MPHPSAAWDFQGRDIGQSFLEHKKKEQSKLDKWKERRKEEKERKKK